MAVPAPVFKGPDLTRFPNGLVPSPKSGGLKSAERITYTEVLEGAYADALTYWNTHYRGTIWTITIGGVASSFIVDDASLENDRGGRGTVTVNYCYLYVVPPDEFAMTPFEENPPIERHPFFAALTHDDISKARASFMAASAAGKTALDSAITGTAHAALTTSLVNKWLLGEETFYLAGVKFQHTLHSFSPPTTTRGGFIQAPFGIFASLAPAGLGWLREGDELLWNNGLYKLTRTWVGAVGGWWDSDLY